MLLTRNDTVFLAPDIQTEPVAYLCRASSVFEAAGKIINETVVESVISLQVEQRNRDGYIVCYRVADNYWQNANPAVGKTSAFIRELAELMQELIIQLDFNGNIIAVLNKEEILQEWNDFKNTTVKNFDFNPRVEKEMIAQWEQEFEQLDAKLRSGIPYALFFHGLWGEKKIFSGVYATEEVTVPSKLFHGINLLCQQQEKTTDGGDDFVNIDYNLGLERFDQPMALVKQKLQFVYNLDTSDKIPYTYAQELHYRLQPGTGLIQQASGFINETINEEIRFRQDFSVSRIGE